MTFASATDAINDDRFELIRTFHLTIPDDYNPAHQLVLFSDKYRPEFRHFHDMITHDHFLNSTHTLAPGKQYTVGLLVPRVIVRFDACLEVMDRMNALLVGPRGIMSMYQFAKEQFIKGRIAISLDKKELFLSLGNSKKYEMIPSLLITHDDKKDFNLIDFGNNDLIGLGKYLVCYFAA